MTVLITGSEGFIGSNLTKRLDFLKIDYLSFTKSNSIEELVSMIEGCDCIIHLAGTNRSPDDSKFVEVNVNLTSKIVKTLLTSGNKRKKILFASSTKADEDSIYGKTKRKAEDLISSLDANQNVAYQNLRLPNIFGKWCKPDYNSVVATFMFRIQRNLPITISNPATKVELLYIDNLIDFLVSSIQAPIELILEFKPRVSKISLQELYAKCKYFNENLPIANVGMGLDRQLYATFLSYKDKEKFTTLLSPNYDDRGSFTEIMKTVNSGQFSFFTAKPGITRGGHYHNSKNEKFLVVQGCALFRFKNIKTGEIHKIETTSSEPILVETIPGWAHDITNIGRDTLIVFLWANEIFDIENPDTFSYSLEEKV